MNNLIINFYIANTIILLNKKTITPFFIVNLRRYYVSLNVDGEKTLGFGTMAVRFLEPITMASELVDFSDDPLPKSAIFMNCFNNTYAEP